MLQKRIRKKLLAGLGSTIGIGVTAIVGSFGIKPIINRREHVNNLLLGLNKIKENNISNLPNYNIANENMFYNTENLKFHLGDAASGQTVTAFGWLGTYTATTNQLFVNENFGNNTLVLTGWNGQILWTNNANKTKIYDAKYNHATKEIYVVRGNDPSGTLGMSLTIHDVFTGNIKSSIEITGNLRKLLPDNTDWNSGRQKHSGYQDFITLPDKKVIWTYQLDINRYKDSQQGIITTSYIENDSWITSTTSKIIENGNIKNLNIGIFGKENDLESNFLITNPYMTIQENQVFMNWFQISSKGYDYPVRISRKLNFSNPTNLTPGDYNEETVNTISIYTIDAMKRNYVGNKLENALTKPTRNMFDQNYISFPYYYSQQLTYQFGGYTGENNEYSAPLFNVFTVYHSGFDNGIDNLQDNKYTKNYTFGKAIMDYYLVNVMDKSPEDIFRQGILELYPWPFSEDYKSIFNRPIAISPFDNTIIYVSQPNFLLGDSKKVSIFSGKEEYKDWYASLWIATNDYYDGGKAYKNIIIPNNDILNTNGIRNPLLDTKFLSNPNDIYNNITFDLKSSERINNGENVNLSLYFNQTGSNKNKEGNVLKTSRIGILDLNGTGGFSESITDNKGVYGAVNMSPWVYSITADENNTLAYLSSGADLTKWYPRTYFNINNPANEIQNGKIILNANTERKRAEVTILNDKLNGQDDIFNKVDGIDLISNYFDSKFKMTNAVTWTPQVKVINNVNNEFDGLRLEISYIPNINKNNDRKFLSSDNSLIFKQIVHIPNASKTIFSELGKQIKLYKMMGNTENIKIQWYLNNPSKGKYNEGFGNINNIVLGWTNSNALRLELQIDPNPNNLSEVNKKIPQQFTQSYPIESNIGETTFEQILSKYIDWKAKNITKLLNENVGGEYGGGAIGLNSIAIKAFLKLNPEASDHIIKDQVLYKINDDKFILYGKNDKLAIYDDKFSLGDRFVYNQSSLKFSSNKNYGWNINHINANLYTDLISGLNINDNNKLEIKIDPVLINDIIRDSDNNDLLNVEYVKNVRNSKLKFTFKNDYLKKRFKIFNQIFGLKLILQVKTTDNKDNWQDIKDFNDDEMEKLIDNKSEFLIDVNKTNITKIKFKLKNIDQNDVNKFMFYYPDTTLNEPKFESKEYALNFIKINVNHDWLSQQKLDFGTNNYWNLLNSNQIQNVFNRYVETIKQKLNIENQKNEIDIQFSIDNGNTWINSEQLSNELYRRSNDYSNNDLGLFALWNGKTGINSFGTIIQAKFVLTQQAENSGLYELFDESGDNKFDDYINTDNVFTRVNINEYVQVLETQRTQVITSGTDDLISIIPPTMTGEMSNGFLFGRDFDTIISILKKFGIQVEYQKLDGNWTQNKSDLRKYNPQNPVIRIRFRVLANKTVVLSTDGTEIVQPDTTSNKIITLRLNIPRVLIVNQATFNKYSETGISAAFNGNTYNLSARQDLTQEFLQDIENDNANTGNKPTLTNHLAIKFRLGTNDEFKTETEFINYLKTLTTTNWETNQIQVKLEIIKQTNQDDDYILDSEAAKIHDLYANNNSIIKKWIHGNEIETGLSNITASGTTENITYSFPKVIENIKNKVTKGIKLQYSLNQNIQNSTNPATGTDIAIEWVDDLPTSIPPLTQSLKVQVVALSNENFVYGPEQESKQKVHSINLSKLKQIIKVNNSWLSSYKINANFIKELTVDNIKQYESSVLNQIPDTALKVKVEIRYTFNGKNNLDANNLFLEIQTLLKNYDQPEYGLLQLWDKAKFGKKITATFVKSSLNDVSYDIEPIVANGSLSNDIDTSNIRTLIDLKEYVIQLSDKKINVEFGQTDNSITGLLLPDWNGKSGSAPLVGQSFATIKNRLKELGVLIEYRNDKTNGWVTKENLISYNPQNPYVEIRFRLDNTKNITLSVLDDKDVTESSTDSASNVIKLNLNIPVKISVNQLFIEWFINENPASGNTKNLIIDETKESKFINKIKEENQEINANVANANIYVEYQLGDSAWLKRQELIEYLNKQINNQVTNELKFRLKVENSDVNNPDFAIDSTEHELSAKNISSSANIKIYINRGNYLSTIANLLAKGTNEDYVISGIEEWNVNLATGLTAQLTADKDPNTNDATNISNYPSLPKLLNVDKDLWIRLKVQDGYYFEQQINASNPFTTWTKINTDGIKAIIKLQSTLLEQIKLSGNTKKLTINEQLVLDEINKVLPTNKPNLVKIEYTIDSVTWYKKDSFTTKLLELNGAKDSHNFIVKREDIKARFTIDKTVDTENAYILNIDNDNVIPENAHNFNKVLISDTLNTSVKGYINVDKLNNFTTDNFAIRGTTSKPKIIIQNCDLLNNLLNVYSTDGIFEIKFTTILKSDGTPDYSNQAYQLWNPNTGLINEEGLIQLGATLSANNIFYIGFFAKNQNYEVYQNGILQQYGYSLNISSNVNVTIEIENPFTQANSTLGLWFRGTDGNAKFYQNYGGFKLSVIEANGNNNYQTTAQQLLQNSSLTSEEKNALEFVYTIFNGLPNDEELNNITSVTVINDYSSNKWKQLPDPDSEGFITGLNLKVNQYVFVALRVKEEFASKQDGGFSLKNDQHSVTDKNISRVNGYKIKTSALQLDWENMELLNILNNFQKPLDGFSTINKLQVKTDTDSNYLGVNLKLNVFNEFYENSDNKPIVVNGNIKLVKRKSEGSINKGNYKDASGQDIKDKNGNPIPILVDANGLPMTPTEVSSSTNSIELFETTPGIFNFVGNEEQTSRFSLFRNQKIQIEYVAKQGQSIGNLYDYYLDDVNNSKVDHTMDKEIKYPLENTQNIVYKFDTKILDVLKYENTLNPSNPNPITGQSKLATPLVVIRTDAKGRTKNVIGATNLEKMLMDDFGSLLKFQFSHIKIDGSKNIYDGADVSQINTLQNGDKIVVNIVVKNENDYIFSETFNSIVITVSGLFEKSPEKEFLQYLRVEQNGYVNGKGLFRVLINNPNDDSQTSDVLLPGYKFAIRVWNSNKTIKINWTTNQNHIKYLSNGDKVEWKLVTDKNQPVVDSYYNTISNGTNQKSDGSIDYLFAQINGSGYDVPEIISTEIGKIPLDNNIYPEKSGFVISGLKDAQDELFVITTDMFTNIMNELEPYYSGINGNGAMKFARFDNSINKDNLYVTNTGEIIDKSNTQLTLINKNTTTIQEMKLIDFIHQIEFIVTRPNESNLDKFIETTFRYSSNDTNIDNKLYNGDLISARFTNGDGSKTLLSNFGTVKNLSLINDPVNPLWYVLFGGAAIATLGIFALIYFLIRNKKIKK